MTAQSLEIFHSSPLVSSIAIAHYIANFRPI